MYICPVTCSTCKEECTRDLIKDVSMTCRILQRTGLSKQFKTERREKVSVVEEPKPVTTAVEDYYIDIDLKRKR